ncbi:Exopolysaccharide biosynthesis polyprenyl glycosylphosphotransferase OS=Tsukamurella paurometabola(strain ATCC 8368 / DSM / CCUG 35730 / CIP 100753 / JCM 10117 / KCTC 9821 / NBRC 16120 / NCIMB 702349 / NCTC 13040)OX=521096 GN=Tpau_2615 PE=3 SV=1 [Tsukamurella paurometabola]|uniref:Exopolysaccharide biosynthesis polyprenyl glycosylphosphotransferase n=2 Tax=Tsukamurella paurometabola TaxID=2061 RepID=D5US13_TSUPD|nr:exopolysaccharide biosynthesis polyprenyl glycosylphosphotransferase [Tsukamurella paurometabola DSM 20162]SUP34597.1 Putative colanic biosynthesis UDP-glucose lipid carrier transferase [Tsukamurella paurometabola]
MVTIRRLFGDGVAGTRAEGVTPSSPALRRARHTRRVRTTDTVVISAAVLIAQFVRFGDDAFARFEPSAIPLFAFSAALVVLWKVALHLAQADDEKVIGSGVAEYNSVLTASLGLVGALALAGMLTNFVFARGYWALAFGLGVAGLLISRTAWRRRVHADRRSGRVTTSLLVVGTRVSVARFQNSIAGNPARGYQVVGVVLTDAGDDDAAPCGPDGTDGVRFPNLETGLAAIRDRGECAVALTAIDALEVSAMRELTWKLDEMHIDLMVAPGVLAAAGPRVAYRSEAGLPLMHIERPRYLRATTLMKRLFDVTLGSVLLLLLSPVFVITALAVKFDDRGPIFYRSERMGLADRPFGMWKFRTMVVGADRMLSDLADLNEAAGVLFKMQNDPRVTRVGKLLRRYSIDELPQLFNVIAGTMSLVGPRPPLLSEVAAYDAITTKRMLVRPGMTGLWQVSGRSTLSWEETVHLDLTYVENWSLAADLQILWRTFRAVREHHGAY